MAIIDGNGDDNYLIGTSGADTISGYQGYDSLKGLEGNDVLYGGSGIDDLDGGPGDDMLYGGDSTDFYHVDSPGDQIFEEADGGSDWVYPRFSVYLSTYLNIEALSLDGAGDLYGVGNDEDNSINGNDGDNLLIAGGGADRVGGESGNDAIFGQAGDDYILGGSGIDYVVGGIGIDTIDGGSGADELHGEQGDDALVGGEGFFTDIMVGGDGNDWLDGQSGLGDYDLMYGNLGNDRYLVDTPADLVFEQAGEGVDTVFAAIEGAGYYLYENIENLTLWDETPYGVGNALANVLTGNYFDNWLLGGAGNDTLNGDYGNDVLFGESGADAFIFEIGTGSDIIGDFELGIDKIVLSDYADYDLDFAQIQGRMFQDGNVGAIYLPQGDIVILHNVTMADLTAGDFVLA
ncbi:MAG: calcium-binding protein [Pseudomonadota bacterium]